MATRYWVGGAGTWDATSTANWSATSGGAGGASAPTAADDVIFDNFSDTSANYTVTCNSAVCLTLSVSNTTPVASFGGTITAYGNVAFNSCANTLGLALVLAPTANMQLLVGSASSNTIGGTVFFTTAVSYTLVFGSSATYNNPTYRVQAGTFNTSFNTVGTKSLTVEGGTVTTSGTNFNLVSISSGSLTMNGALTCQNMALSGGTLAKATYTLTCSTSFNCSGSTARTISGTSAGATTVLSGSGTVFSCSDATNLTLTNPQTLSVTNTVASQKTLGGPTTGDTASNTFSINVAGTATNTFNISGAFLDVTINSATAKTLSNQTRKIYGNWSGNVSGLTYTAGPDATTFAATTTGRTAQFAASADFPLIFDGVGGAWTLDWRNNTTSVNSDITVTNGSLTFTDAAAQIKSLISNNSNTRTIVLPSTSTLTITGTTPVNFTDSTNLTLTPGTGTLVCSTTGTQVFQGGGKTFPNFSSYASNLSIYGANTFATFNTTPTPPNRINGVVTLYANQTVTSNCAFGNGSTSAASSRILFTSDTLGTQRTITYGGLSSNSYNVDYRDIALSPSVNFSIYRAGNLGGNSGITFPAAKTVYWNLAAGGNWSSTAWSISSGATPNENNFPLAQDTAIIDNTGLTAGNTITLPGTFPALPTIDASSRTLAWTLAGSVSSNIYGSFALNSQATVTYSGTLTFQRRGGFQNITTNGVSLSSIGGIVVENIGGTVSLGSALTMTGDPLTLRRGSFNQAFNLTCGAVTVESTATSYGGNPSTAVSCTNWTFPTTGPTLSLGTNHQLLFTGDFYGGNKSYRTVSPISGGTMTIYDANTFEQIAPAPAFGSTLRFEAGKTQTLTSDFSWAQSVGSSVRFLRSTVPGSQFTWSKSSGTITVGSTDIQDSNATGGATFRALTSDKNVNSGNNLGWIFAAVTAAFLAFFF